MKLALLAILSFMYGSVKAQSYTHEGDSKIIGQCNAGTNIFAQLAYKIRNADTVYTFTIQNRRTKIPEQKCSISFPGNATVVDDLYNTFKKLIYARSKKRKDYTATIVLSGKLVVLAAANIMGNRCVEVYLPQGSNVLTEWQVDKVFGKI